MKLYDELFFICMIWLNGVALPNWECFYGHVVYTIPEDEKAAEEKTAAFTAKLREQGAKEWAE